MSDTSQGPDWWLASDEKWYPPERHPDLQQQQQTSLDMAESPPMTRQSIQEISRTTVPQSFNKLHQVSYKGGWIGLFGGENQLKALERALPQINASGLRVVAAVEDRWSVWKRIGVILLLIITLGFVGKVPDVLLITEPMA